MIEDAKDQMVNERFDGLWLVIETGARWNDMYTGTRQAQHVFEMNGIVGRFSRHQHQATTFLQRYIRSAVDEIGAQARGYGA